MHSNTGNCLGCAKIFNRYTGFYEPLKDWFFNVQLKQPAFHISCGGRGQIDQEAAFARGASNAHWLQSAHNYNCAIDTFFMIDGQYRLDADLFEQIAKELAPDIDWYGLPGSSFKEMPHFEIRNWLDLVKQGLLHPVE